MSMPSSQAAQKVEVPWEEFKDAFEEVLKDLELPDEKREQMMQMPVDAKYKLLQHYRHTSSGAEKKQMVSNSFYSRRCSRY